MEPLLRVPMGYRSYSCGTAEAATVHRLGAAVLDELVAAGLPYVGTGAHALFDEKDLANASAALGQRSAWWFGQRGWRTALEQLASGTPGTYEMRVEPRCPYPGHPGACDVELWLGEAPDEDPDGETGATARLTGPRTVTVSTRGGTRTAPPEVTRVLACLDGAQYLHLPSELENDLDFFAATRLANCTLAAAAVLREARRLGVAARPSFGLIVLVPFAGLHTWVDFRVDGRWWAFDPHLVGFLEKAAVIAPGRWDRLASISRLLLRLGPAITSLARHGGLHAEVSLPVRRVA